MSNKVFFTNDAEFDPVAMLTFGLSTHRKHNPTGKAKLYFNNGIDQGKIEFDSPEIYAIIEEIKS